jgi:glutamate racemase
MPVVAVFDSGVGGLSVAAEIRRKLPDATLAYICDNGFFPYGVKDPALLKQRVDQVVSEAVAATRPHAVVIACNTASTVALPLLRSHLTLPVIGTVPAIKPAAALSRKRVIGLLGTPATVAGAYTQDLIDRFAAGCTILRVGSVELVEMAEAFIAGEPPEPVIIRRVLAPFFDRPEAAQPDIVVLACTHFPLLAPFLRGAAPDGVAFIDSGAAIADRVTQILGQMPACGTHGFDRAYFTRDDASLRRLLPGFAAGGFQAAEFFFEA